MLAKHPAPGQCYLGIILLHPAVLLKHKPPFKLLTLAAHAEPTVQLLLHELEGTLHTLLTPDFKQAY